LYRDTEVIGKMDPFLQVDYRDKKFRTKVIDQGGKEPVWNEMLEIPLESLQDTIKIGCYDQDPFTNDLVGEISVPVSTFSSPYSGWMTLEYKGKRSAEILLQSEYLPPRENWGEYQSRTPLG
jgi:Ca2+-dependent lipid-binding protein